MIPDFQPTLSQQNTVAEAFVAFLAPSFSSVGRLNERLGGIGSRTSSIRANDPDDPWDLGDGDAIL